MQRYKDGLRHTTSKHNTQVLGDYYAHDSRPVFQALWQDFGTCEFVVPDATNDGVLWYAH